LDDHILAGAASVLWTPHDQHSELGGHDIELLADVFADPMQFAVAARASPAVDIDDRLDARQMQRQRTTIGASLSHGLILRGWRLRFNLGRRFRLVLLDVFKGKQQLIGWQSLSATAEAVALQLANKIAPAQAFLAPRRG
jgi:hypothetical protein